MNRRLVVLGLLTILGQAAYTLGWLISGPLQDGYSARENFVSELGAMTASTRGS